MTKHPPKVETFLKQVHLRKGEPTVGRIRAASPLYQVSGTNHSASMSPSSEYYSVELSRMRWTELKAIRREDV